MYSFIVIISSQQVQETQDRRGGGLTGQEVQETQKHYAYLSVTYRQNDNYILIYDGKMANCCQNVRGNKTNTKTTTLEYLPHTSTLSAYAFFEERFIQFSCPNNQCSQLTEISNGHSNVCSKWPQATIFNY